MFFSVNWDQIYYNLSGEKFFLCGSHLENRPKALFSKRLLLGRFILLNIITNLYKIVILPVVLYGRENWSLTFSKKRTMRVLRKIFGCKRDWVKRSGKPT
jgi:hypothetical protein